MTSNKDIHVHEAVLMLHGGSKVITCNNCVLVEGELGDEAVFPAHYILAVKVKTDKTPMSLQL